MTTKTKTLKLTTYPSAATTAAASLNPVAGSSASHDTAARTSQEGELISLGDREHLLLRPDTLCGSTKSTEHHTHAYRRVITALVAPSSSLSAPDPDMTAVSNSGRSRESPPRAAASHAGSPTPDPHPNPNTTGDGLGAKFIAEPRTLHFAPAIKSLFQEILTNALDRQFRDEKMKKIEVWIDSDAAGGRNWIRVRNDGQGLPVVYDDERAAWKPTIAFSHFRSGTNFSDADGPRWTAGRNGYGCKATNVFSTRFHVQSADPRVGLLFSQQFSENMLVAGTPVVVPFRLKRGFTDVSFRLDFARLGCGDTGEMTPDVREMLRAATIDAAACLDRRVSLSLDDEPLGAKTLRHFATAFVASSPETPTSSPEKSSRGAASAIAFDTVTGTSGAWEICVVPQHNHPDGEDAAGGPGDGTTTATTGGAAGSSCLAFVNSLQCSQGTHVNYAFARLTSGLEDLIRNKYKKKVDFVLSPAIVKRHVFVILKILLDSPEFSSQTKEKLTTAAARFDLKWEPSAAFLKNLVGGGVVDRIHDDVTAKEMSAARRTIKNNGAASSTGSRRMVLAEKYDAATNVTRASSRCSLLVTEGDSARALAVAGLAVVGRANFGIFALKGKPLNVRNASVEAISKNKEIRTLLNILGLTLGTVYHSLAPLNYKKLVIFSDQDPDGAHIGGLIINVIHALFPSVLVLDPAYVQRFPTPLVRVTCTAGGSGTAGLGAGAPGRRTSDAGSRGGAPASRSFYAKASFDEWWATQEPRAQSRYTVKYFKGLGTSTSALAREYFSHYHDNLVDIVWNAASDELMTRMFQSDNAAQRRSLLTTHYDPKSYVDYGEPTVSLHDFIHKEVLPYSNYSNERNLPSVLDGLKPVQRKALFMFLEKNVVSDVKVAQVAAQIAARTMYHHGEASLVETVIGMAQDHVGVSNVNLFRPEGQFGSRLDPPSVHSAPRYIFTGLDPITRALFPRADDAVLAYNEDEGVSIEPVVYAPVIPMVLVNGAFGIGTGWSTSVPSYNPADLIRACRAAARDTATTRPDEDAGGVEGDGFVPWYAGFTGTIELLAAKNTFRTRGRMTITEGLTSTSRTAVHVTELPVGVWTHPFVENLEQNLMMSASAAAGGGPGSGSPPGTPGSADGGGRRKRKDRADSPPTPTETEGGTATRRAAKSASSTFKGTRFIVSIEKRWTDSRVDLVLHCDRDTLREMRAVDPECLWSVLGMQNEIRVNNMHLYDTTGRLRQYGSVGAIIREFARFRIEIYEKRKARLLADAASEIVVLRNKSRFVSEVMDDTLILRGVPDDEALDALLETRGYTRAPDYAYLLNMSFRTLTTARVVKLRDELRVLELKVQELTGKSAGDLWDEDLNELDARLVEFYRRRAQRYAPHGVPHVAGDEARGARARGSGSTTITKKRRSGDGVVNV
jgi:DNA gyrase/topoisomerase IV subunit B